MANDECANDSRDNCSIPYHLFVLNESNLTGLGFSSDSFKIYRGNQNLMDSLVCVDHCADLVFEYATIIRDECLCGNSAFDNYYNQLFNDSSCNFNCTSYSCGGMTAYRIYRTTREYHYLWNKDKNKSEKYNLIQQGPVNCVLDAPDTKRLMTCKAENKTTMNVEHCMDICKTNGYGCAGLEDGSQCFCGNTSICTKGPFSNDPFPCSSSCPNNPSQTCGGPWALSVYPIESQPLPLYAKILIGFFIGVALIIIILIIIQCYRYCKHQRHQQQPHQQQPHQQQPHQQQPHQQQPHQQQSFKWFFCC